MYLRFTIPYIWLSQDFAIVPINNGDVWEEDDEINFQGLVFIGKCKGCKQTVSAIIHPRDEKTCIRERVFLNCNGGCQERMGLSGMTIRNIGDLLIISTQSLGRHDGPFGIDLDAWQEIRPYWLSARKCVLWRDIKEDAKLLSANHVLHKLLPKCNERYDDDKIYDPMIGCDLTLCT